MPILRWIRPELNANATDAALAVLSPSERRRFDDLAGQRRRAFLAGRLVLRRLVSEMTGEEPGDVQLVAACPDCGREHGKPLAVGSGLHLSLSHASGVVVAGAAWDGPIGIDVERPELSADALRAIGSVAGTPSLVHWTRVEAILKADGRGLRVDTSMVTIESVGGRREGWIADSPQRYDLDEVDLAPGVRVSVAIAR